MTMLPVPPDEQPGLAEEWTEREQPAEPPTEDLRPKRRAAELVALYEQESGHTV